MSRNGEGTRESTLDFPKIWLLRDVSDAVEPKNVAIPSFAQRFECRELKKVTQWRRDT
jgi:hypothetical protein